MTLDQKVVGWTPTVVGLLPLYSHLFLCIVYRLIPFYSLIFIYRLSINYASSPLTVAATSASHEATNK